MSISPHPPPDLPLPENVPCAHCNSYKKLSFWCTICRSSRAAQIPYYCSAKCRTKGWTHHEASCKRAAQTRWNTAYITWEALCATPHRSAPGWTLEFVVLHNPAHWRMPQIEAMGFDSEAFVASFCLLAKRDGVVECVRKGCVVSWKDPRLYAGAGTCLILDRDVGNVDVRKDWSGPRPSCGPIFTGRLSSMRLVYRTTNEENLDINK